MRSDISDNVYVREFYLAAGDGNAGGRMPAGLAVARCIETATDHANLLGVGYDDLKAHGQSWVLSRFVLEMARWPAVNETYSIETWVDSFNRAFSDRFFRIVDCRGEVCGYSRSTWVAIDLAKRQLADISRFDSMRESITTVRECPIRPCGRHRAVGSDAQVVRRRFGYCDIDSNRHVNTVRYVEMLLDFWPLEFHDCNRVSRLEVSFMRECLCGETAELAVADGGMKAEADIRVCGEGRVHFAVEFVRGD